jgi:hypothetical protein
MSETTRIMIPDTERAWYFTTVFQRYGATALAGLLLVECGLVVAVDPATGYETSLVQALPVAYWICFYTVLAGGTLLLVASATTGSSHWRHGLALVLMNYALYIFLPKARGYRFYGRGSADALFHVGEVKVILETGSLPGNWYPAEHVLMSELTMLGVPLDGVTYLTAFLFTALYIVGIGTLVGALTGSQRGLAAGLAAGTPLVFSTFHLTNHPAVNSFMLVPVLLLVVERYRRTSTPGYLILFVLLAVTLVYFHPVTTLFTVAILFAATGYTYAHGRLTGDAVPTISPRLAVVPLTLLFAWLVNFDQTKYKLRTLLFRDRTSPAVSQVQEATTVVEFTPVELFGKIVTLYGAQTMYVLAAGVFVMFVVRSFVRDDGRFEWGLTTVLFAVGAVVSSAFLFRSLIVSGRIRAARFVLLFAVLLTAMALLYCLRRRVPRWTVTVTLVVLLVGGLAANGAYEPNQHTTYAEYDGSKFLLSNYEPSADIHSVGTRTVIENFVLGSNHPNVSPAGFDSTNPLPRELGYDSADATAADTFGEGYVVTKTYDVRQHTAAYFTDDQQELKFRYDERHLERLHSDRTANKIYANGGFTAWTVAPKTNATG